MQKTNKKVQVLNLWSKSFYFLNYTQTFDFSNFFKIKLHFKVNQLQISLYWTAKLILTFTKTFMSKVPFKMTNKLLLSQMMKIRG